jgi:ABC-type amino acid transport system permease subunit
MTSLGTQVRILEITGKAKLYASTSYRYLEAFTAIMVTYLLVNFVIERIFRFAEIRAKNYKKLAVNESIRKTRASPR